MGMTHRQVVAFIADPNRPAKFRDAVQALCERLFPWTVDNLLAHLPVVGTIPEQFAYDSSEEKLYAKYCDMVVLGFFEVNGMMGKLSERRGGAPDVIASCKEHYTIVADVKAFRATRTAKNPKDYKIDALNTWRIKHAANYACIVASQYPSSRSRVYQEAIQRQVVLLRFSDIEEILSRYGALRCERLEKLWRLTTYFQTPQVTGDEYWAMVKKVMEAL